MLAFTLQNSIRAVTCKAVALEAFCLKLHNSTATRQTFRHTPCMSTTGPRQLVYHADAMLMPVRTVMYT